MDVFQASASTVVPGSSSEVQLSSVQEVGGDNSTTLSASMPPAAVPSTSLTGLRKLVSGPRRLYKRRRPSQLVPRHVASSSGNSRAAMLSMIEREGAGETALHKATRLGYEVSEPGVGIVQTITVQAAGEMD